MLKIKDKHFEPLIPKQKLNAMIKALAMEIIHDQNYNPVLVIVLKGAGIFGAHLAEQLYPLSPELEYVRLSSYDGTESTGTVKQVLGISRDLYKRNIIIVEDIVETGLTMVELKDYLINEKQVNSVKICSLFTRPKNYKTNVVVDYVGMELTDDEFIIGFGLDYDEEGRCLDEIYKLVE
jgi:hypoxanthine phosphoribosyltransferase